MSQYSNTVSFQAPTDYGIEQQAVDRQRKLAEAMMIRSQQPQQGGQMIGNRYVPQSWTQGLAQALQGPAAMYQQNKADEKSRDIAGKQRAAYAAELEKFGGLMNGTPAQSFQTGANEMGDEAATQNVAAVPGDRRAALAMALGAQNPMLQQVGMQQMLKGLEPTKFGLTPQYDQNGNAFVLNERGERKMLEGVKSRDKMEVLPSGQAVNPYNIKEGTNFNDPNKLMSIGPDGQPVVNQQLVGVKKDIGRAGATNVSVKTDVKTGESLAGQVGPMMKDSTSIAEGAVKQIDAAQRIVKAIDSDKAFAGPLANTRLKVAQIGQMLGVGGKDEAERIANTRSAIRGLSELTLQGRQQMKGQGAITESEGKLAEKAMSGNIEELTGAEVKQLAKASERAARFNLGEHKRKLAVMESNPALAGIAPFYRGPDVLPEVPGAVGGEDPLGLRK